MLRIPAGGQYQTIPVAPLDTTGRLRGYSAFLGLELHASPDWFQLLNPATGAYLPDWVEYERELASERAALASERQALASERAARQEMERLLREHGIALPPSPPPG